MVIKLGKNNLELRFYLPLKQVLFYTAGVLMFILVCVWFVGSISFLTSNIDRVFTAGSKVESSIKFDIEGFESLDLIRK